jgi:[amino-group carrier protein]-gamma-(L-lysyl/L-ornithyl)-L-glutamate aminotransferase
MKLTFDQITNLEKNNEVTLYPKRGIALAKGKGIYVFDTANKRYIDCMTNIGVNILGYEISDVANPIAEQLQTLTSVHQSFYSGPRAEALSEITSVLPAQLSKIIFTNSGAESVEAALKLAISATGKKKFIAAVNGYHGRTFGALAATGQEKYREPFLPLMPEFTHVPFNDLTSLKNTVSNETAAILLEPIQGEGGIIIPDKNYLQQVKKLCEEKHILLICDEVQSAIRTGTWLASEQFGIVPDIVCLSKSLSYGLPFGIVATTKEVSDLMPKGAHGSTFAGNPLSCAAAASVISYVKKKKLLANATGIGEYFLRKLKTIRYPVIKEVRGRGLMIAMELTVPSTTYIKKLQDHGLITIPTAGNAIRFLPPITVTKKDVDVIITIVKEVFS